MNRKTVLVVEDDVHVAEMLRQMLLLQDYHTIVVHGGKWAIEALQLHKPDIVLLDLMMAGVNGLEVARFMQREPGLEDVPIVIVSVLGQPHDVQAALAAGASAYLTKPIDMEALLFTVEDKLAA